MLELLLLLELLLAQPPELCFNAWPHQSDGHLRKE
jgi:hypothetical protein